jgi:hypothetical protein
MAKPSIGHPDMLYRNWLCVVMGVSIVALRETESGKTVRKRLGSGFVRAGELVVAKARWEERRKEISAVGGLFAGLHSSSSTWALDPTYWVGWCYLNETKP